MEARLDHIDAADWSYKGEGAANIVLAYTGTSPAFIGKVLRIQKVARKATSLRVENEEELAVFTEEERLVWRDVTELLSAPTREAAERLYAKHVMSPLLGPNHVDSGSRVPVSKEFLECIANDLLSKRPASRVDAARIDTACDYVLLLSDHSIFPQSTLEGGRCISVEIKPKCGFLPLSKFIAEGNAVKGRTTRFRMHQFLKMHQHEISELSEYDPLDLFSGSKERKQKAIRNLYSTPQNNFRVFLDGSLIFGGLGGGSKKTNAVIGDAFEDAIKGVIEADDGLRTKSFMQLVAETVHDSRVLDRLLEVQKFDSLDVEGAIHAYYNAVSQPCVVCKELDEARLPNRYSSLHSITMDESLKIVKDYLIAATAKDLSLMITFKPSEGGDCASPYSCIHLESTNQTFEYKVNFIDLDLKRLRKIEDYYKLDKKIVNYYQQVASREHEEENVLDK